MAGTQIFAAQIGGIALEIELLEDGFEKAIARYEYPYRDGAELEDMGQRARMVRFRCYFWDSAGHETYDAHLELLGLLESQELLELVHPQYGPIKGCVESVFVRHDDRLRTAEIDIRFVENFRGGTEDAGMGAHYDDVEAGVEGGYLDAVQGAIAAFSDEAAGILGLDAGGVLSRALDPALGIVDQFSDAGYNIRNFLVPVEACVNTLEATLSQVANPTNSLVSAINFAANLPGRVAGSIARCCERYALASETLKSSPLLFIQSLAGSYSRLYGVFPASAGASSSAATRVGQTIFPKCTRIVSASQLSIETASIYRDDLARWHAIKRSEKIKSFDSEGFYSPASAAGRAMTANELEQSLYTARTVVQEAVDFIRANDLPKTTRPASAALSGSSAAAEDAQMQDPAAALKSCAWKLTNHVDRVKLEREKVTEVSLDNPMPLHLVCLKYGLPYNAAERVIAVNPQIRNPNFAGGTVKIYAG